MTRKTLCTIGLLALSQVSTCTARSYIEAFKELDKFWPTPDSTRDRIASAFGPRIKTTLGVVSNDFHRGIDIMGDLNDPILAIADGRIEKIHTYSGGGLTVITRHFFSGTHTAGDKDVILLPDKTATDRFYTMNMHLDSIPEDLVRYQSINKGDVIGYMGKSGTATNVHLHQEIRIGTRCSLEWALDNPSSTCNEHNYDPHINPGFMWPHLPDEEFQRAIVKQVTELSATTDGDFQILMHDNQPYLNRVLFEQINLAGQVVTSHLLDLNCRYGYDPSSEETLNYFDKTKPYLFANSFGDAAHYWDINFIIPRSFVSSKSLGDQFRLTLDSIWETEETRTQIMFGDSADVW